MAGPPGGSDSYEILCKVSAPTLDMVMAREPEELEDVADSSSLRELLDLIALAKYLDRGTLREFFVGKLRLRFVGKSRGEMARMLEDARVPLLSDKFRAARAFMDCLSAAYRLNVEAARGMLVDFLTLGGKDADLIEEIRGARWTDLRGATKCLAALDHHDSDSVGRWAVGEPVLLSIRAISAARDAGEHLGEYTSNAPATESAILEWLAGFNPNAVEIKRIHAIVGVVCERNAATRKISARFEKVDHVRDSTANAVETRIVRVVEAAALAARANAEPGHAGKVIEQELNAVIEANQLAVQRFNRRFEKIKAAEAFAERFAERIKACSADEISRQMRELSAEQLRIAIKELREATEKAIPHPGVRHILATIAALIEDVSNFDDTVRVVRLAYTWLKPSSEDTSKVIGVLRILRDVGFGRCAKSFMTGLSMCF